MVQLLLLALAAVAAAAIWQHLRYLEVRRQRVDDRQAVVYGSDAFHAATFLKLAAGADRATVLETVRGLRDAIEASEGGQVVYAGLVALTMVPSHQIENDWDAVVLAQYPSREAFDRQSAGDGRTEVLARCERTYTQGVVRPAVPNLLIPLGLGASFLADRVRGRERILPFRPVDDEDAVPQIREMRKELERLDAYRDLREDAVVIVNLLLPGTKEQRAADRAYTGEMMRGMAEGGYGPMHIGRTVRVEGDHDFRRFAAVYYPGIDHMQAMIGSTFMNRIGPGKQLGDTLAVATIPVLSKL